MFTILDYSSALEYSIIRRYTYIVYYYYYTLIKLVHSCVHDKHEPDVSISLMLGHKFDRQTHFSSIHFFALNCGESKKSEFT